MPRTVAPESPLFDIDIEGMSATAASGSQAEMHLYSLPFYGKFLLKGRIDDAAFASAAEEAIGCSLPTRHPLKTKIHQGEGGGVDRATAGQLLVQSSPRSWLLIAPPDKRDGIAMRLQESFAQAMTQEAPRGGWVDMSAGLHLLSLEGKQASALLERSCPLDLDGRAFEPGTFARSLFGPYTISIIRHAEGFWLLVERSYAQSFVEYLLDLAAPFSIQYSERTAPA